MEDTMNQAQGCCGDDMAKTSEGPVGSNVAGSIGAARAMETYDMKLERWCMTLECVVKEMHDAGFMTVVQDLSGAIEIMRARV